MLNKKVCINCVEREFSNPILVDRLFRINWNKLRIAPCLPSPPSFSAKSCSIDDDPPDFCPYRLEHIVSTENND